MAVAVGIAVFGLPLISGLHVFATCLGYRGYTYSDAYDAAIRVTAMIMLFECGAIALLGPPQ